MRAIMRVSVASINTPLSPVTIECRSRFHRLIDAAILHRAPRTDCTRPLPNLTVGIFYHSVVDGPILDRSSRPVRDLVPHFDQCALMKTLNVEAASVDRIDDDQFRTLLGFDGEQTIKAAVVVFHFGLGHLGDS